MYQKVQKIKKESEKRQRETEKKKKNPTYEVNFKSERVLDF